MWMIEYILKNMKEIKNPKKIKTKIDKLIIHFLLTKGKRIEIFRYECNKAVLFK